MSIDWSKPETLRFRNFDMKIIEVLIPKDERCRSSEYAVTVFYENKNGEIHATNVALDGRYVKDSESSRDIIQTKKVPLSFWEIVKLIYDNEGLMVDDGDFEDNISEIDIEDETFQVGIVDYSNEQLYNNFVYTIDDGKTWHRFEKDEAWTIKIIIALYLRLS